MAAIRFLSWSRLWLQPETRLVILGNLQDLDAVLYDNALRNTRHAVYIALQVNEPGVFGNGKNILCNLSLLPSPAWGGIHSHSFFLEMLELGNINSLPSNDSVSQTLPQY